MLLVIGLLYLFLTSKEFTLFISFESVIVERVKKFGSFDHRVLVITNTDVK